MNVQIEASWKVALQKEFLQPYFTTIVHKLKTEKQQGKTIYPEGKNIFNAFNLTPLPNVKVVILGQDPYHQPNQAHGLSFSVLPPTPPPPSLGNIYKALQSDVNFTIPTHGNLTAWATQGVLLLNSTLTVLHNQANSHSHIGWQIFTNKVIETISQQKNNAVFLLWGNQAIQKKTLINTTKHLVLESVHPSPLSAYRGFLDCKHFSQTNQYLTLHKLPAINWQL